MSKYYETNKPEYVRPLIIFNMLTWRCIFPSGCWNRSVLMAPEMNTPLEKIKWRKEKKGNYFSLF